MKNLENQEEKHSSIDGEIKNPLDSHPCFSAKASKNYGRIHLPVAPKCNIQCRFCNRKYDCVCESRPGVTSKVLPPTEALELVDSVVNDHPEISVIGIAGPGDPLANIDETLETVRLVNKAFPQLQLCLSTNGLALPDVVDELIDAGVKFLTVTVNAISLDVAEQVVSWVKFDGKILKGKEGAEVLLRRQREGIRLVKERGIYLKINTVLIPEINGPEIGQIAEYAHEAGADIYNLLPLIPADGTDFAGRETVDAKTLRYYRSISKKLLPVSFHCRQCRADAIGMLGQDCHSAYYGVQNE